MPQMAPMWWTTIFLMTILLMLLCMIFNYFLISKKIDTNLKYSNKTFNWKW